MTTPEFRRFSGPRRHIARVAAGVLATLLLAAPMAACDDAESPQDFLTRAEEHRDKGKLKASIIELKNALQQAPNNADARWLLGLNYLDMGMAFAAETELRRARDAGINSNLILLPLGQAWLTQRKFDKVLEIAKITDGMREDFKAKVLVLRGNAEANQKELKKAKDTFDEALRYDPRASGAFLGLGNVALGRSDMKGAEEELRKAIDIAPDDREVLIFQAEFAFRKGEYAGSENAYQKLVDRRPERVSFQLGLVRAQIATGKLKPAIATLDLFLKRAANHPNANFLRSLAAYQAKDYETAAVHAEAVLKLNRNHLSSILIAGAASYARGQNEQAVSHLQRFVDAVPTNAVARNLLGATLLRMSRPKEALRTLKPMADDESKDANLLALIGTAAVRSGDLRAGSEYFERSVRAAPENAQLRVALGRTEIALGEWEKGIQDIERALEIDPKMERAEIMLVMNLLKSGRYDRAIATAERLQKKRPDSPTPYTLLGVAHFKKGEEKEAREFFKKALSINPGAGEAANNLAQLAIREGKLGVAKELYQGILKQRPDDYYTTMRLARVEALLGNRDEVRRLLERVVEKFPQLAAGRIFLGQFFLLSGQPSLALQVMNPALQFHPKNPELLELVGKAQMVARKRFEAVGTFASLTKVQPSSVEANFLYAAALIGTLKWEEAHTALQKAISLNPEHFPARILIAVVFMQRKQLVDARKIIEGLKRDKPDHPEVSRLEGALAVAENKPAKAIEHYNEALEARPSFNVARRLALARVWAGDKEGGLATLEDWISKNSADRRALLDAAGQYQNLGRLGDARRHLETLVKLSPDNWIGRNDLAWVLLKSGDATTAYEHAKRAREIAPRNPIVTDTFAMILLKQGKTEQAVKLLRQASESASGVPGIRFHLAQALARNGEKIEAQRILNMVLAEHRTFDERKEAEAFLEKLGD